VRGWLRRALLLVLVVTTLAPQEASAITNDTWEVAPTVTARSTAPSRVYFIYNLSPGQVLHDSVTIRNLTQRPLAFNLFASDAVNTPGNGQFGLKGPDAPKTDVARWVSLPPSPLTVPGQAHVDLPFTVVVPAGATPGDHGGGVVVAEVQPSGKQAASGAQVNVVRALAVRVYARVSGPVRAGLAVSSLKITARLPAVPHVTGNGVATITYTVTNTGNVREAATARVHLTDLFGRTIANLPDLKLVELLPTGRATITQQWRGVPAAGRFTAHLALVTSDATAVAQARFWAIPWLVLGVIALAIVLIVVTVALRRRRRRVGA